MTYMGVAPAASCCSPKIRKAEEAGPKLYPKVDMIQNICSFGYQLDCSNFSLVILACPITHAHLHAQLKQKLLLIIFSLDPG